MRGERQIVIPIFNNEYKVVVCWGSDKSVRRVLDSFWYPRNIDLAEDRKNRRGITYRHPECYPIIVLRGFPKDPEEVGTLAHEAVHAINYIFEYIYEESRDEVYAHCIASIVRETLRYEKIKVKNRT